MTFKKNNPGCTDRGDCGCESACWYLEDGVEGYSSHAHWLDDDGTDVGGAALGAVSSPPKHFFAPDVVPHTSAPLVVFAEFGFGTVGAVTGSAVELIVARVDANNYYRVRATLGTPATLVSSSYVSSSDGCLEIYQVTGGVATLLQATHWDSGGIIFSRFTLKVIYGLGYIGANVVAAGFRERSKTLWYTAAAPAAGFGVGFGVSALASGTTIYCHSIHIGLAGTSAESNGGAANVRCSPYLDPPCSTADTAVAAPGFTVGPWGHFDGDPAEFPWDKTLVDDWFYRAALGSSYDNVSGTWSLTHSSSPDYLNKSYISTASSSAVLFSKVVHPDGLAAVFAGVTLWTEPFNEGASNDDVLPYGSAIRALAARAPGSSDYYYAEVQWVAGPLDAISYTLGRHVSGSDTVLATISESFSESEIFPFGVGICISDGYLALHTASISGPSDHSLTNFGAPVLVIELDEPAANFPAFGFGTGTVADGTTVKFGNYRQRATHAWYRADRDANCAQCFNCLCCDVLKDDSRRTPTTLTLTISGVVGTADCPDPSPFNATFELVPVQQGVVPYWVPHGCLYRLPIEACGKTYIIEAVISCTESQVTLALAAAYIGPLAAGGAAATYDRPFDCFAEHTLTMSNGGGGGPDFGGGTVTWHPGAETFICPYGDTEHLTAEITWDLSETGITRPPNRTLDLSGGVGDSSWTGYYDYPNCNFPYTGEVFVRFTQIYCDPVLCWRVDIELRCNGDTLCHYYYPSASGCVSGANGPHFHTLISEGDWDLSGGYCGFRPAISIHYPP